MSNKVTALVGGTLLMLAFLAGTTQGCGSSSGSDNPVDLCNRGCDKFVMCDPEAQPFLAQCKSLCSSTAPGGGGTCTNQTAVVNAYKACLNATCADLEACLDAVPECEGGGAGGTTGGGGSTGAAGSTGAGGAGAANCSICDKAASCCLGIPGQTAATCMSFSAATCNMVSGANQTTLIQACQGVITGGASLSPPPAACL